MNTLVLDLRQSVRGVWKAQGFLVAAVLSLGLGIGANLATFSVLRAVFAPDLAWRNPEELFHVGRKDAEYPMLPDTIDASPERFRLWSENQSVLAPMAAWARSTAVLGGAIEPRSVLLCRVSPEFWPTLGVQPLLGRLPQADEESALVVSHRLWMSALGGGPGALGKKLTAAGHSYTLAAVLPPSAAWFGMEAFVPLVLTETERAAAGQYNFLQLFGRVRPGVHETEVQAAFRTMNARLQSTIASEKQISATTRPLLTLINWRTRGGQQLLGWVSLFVTALASVNLCMLVLGRSAARLQELGIRQALGARPGQLFTPLFADLLVAAVPGLAVGWAFAIATGGLLEAFLPTSLTVFHGPSATSVAVGVGAALLLAAVGGGIPALLLPRLAGSWSLQGTRSSGGTGHRWTQRGLVAAQVALAVTLLSSFALVHRSVEQLRDAPVGITAENRLLATLSLPAEGQPELVRRQVEVGQALERIRALPGVEAAGGTNLLPVVSGGGNNGNLRLAGREKPVFTYGRDVTDGYFEAAGIPLREGRTFRRSDIVTPPEVAIVSESFARDYFPGESVVGRVIPASGGSLTIVGVVGDTRMDDLRQTTDTQTFYTPFAADRLDLVVKTLNPKALLPEVRRALRAQWPDVSLDEVRPLSDAMERGSASAAQRAALMGLLAALALGLTVTGIYGVLSRQVESRRHEMGIRLALGGQPGQVLGLVLRQSMTAVAVGLAVGLAGAVAMAHVIQNQLYEVGPLDPLSHLFAQLLLATTALVAFLPPALRASRVAPSETLREP